MVKLAGELFHKFGRELSEKIIRQHYELNDKNVATPLKEHLREFTAAWDLFLSNAIKSLSASERRIFDQLNSGPQREAFMLIRSFARLAKGNDFPVAQLGLADRLSITQPGAGWVISKLVELRAIERTMDACVNSKSARYRWTA
jgi:hypothetical protein